MCVYTFRIYIGRMPIGTPNTFKYCKLRKFTVHISFPEDILVDEKSI